MTFVDTNYFLRYLLRDNEAQFQEVQSLFETAIKREVQLGTSIIVLFELYWVLSSFYEKEKPAIVDTLTNIVSLAFISFENRDIFAKALQIYATTTFDLEDAYNIAYARALKIKTFKTFDTKLNNYLAKHFT